MKKRVVANSNLSRGKKNNLSRNLLIFLLSIFIILSISVLSVYRTNLITGYVNFQGYFFSKFISLVSLGELSIDLLEGRLVIIIYSPQNITYNFSISNLTYPILLNVSANKNVSIWQYTLIDLSHNVTVYTNVSFVPNSYFDAVRRENLLIVDAFTESGETVQENVTFFVNVPNMAPMIENISNPVYSCEGQQLYKTFYAADLDEDSVSSSLSPQYPFSPFYIRAFDIINLTISRHLLYSGTLSKSDAGGVNNGYRNFSEIITASDGNNTDSINRIFTVIEVNNRPQIEDIGVQVVWSSGEFNNFYYQVNVTDREDGGSNSGNLSFALMFFNESSFFNISSRGIINFTANSTSLGLHTIAVCANDKGILRPHQNISLCGQDGGNITSCKNFTLRVTNENRPPNITFYQPHNLTFTAIGTDFISFNITRYDPDGPEVDSYWYLDNEFEEFHSYYDSNRSNDSITIQMGCGVSGDHTVFVRVTDGQYDATLQWNITVISIACRPPTPFGGAGGGGGIQGLKAFFYCNESWGCEEWAQCNNLNAFSREGKIISEYDSSIQQRCNLFNWKGDVCGFQTRKCIDLNYCGTNKSMPGILKECYYTTNPTCNDSIRNCHDNQCEVLVDCGGPCTPCPTCSDGIKNQNEDGIDCGGPCKACKNEVPYGPSMRIIITYSFFSIFILVVVIILRLMLRYYQNKSRLDKIQYEKSTK